MRISKMPTDSWIDMVYKKEHRVFTTTYVGVKDSTTMSPTIASLLFLSLLLVPQLSTSYYTSHTRESRQFFIRSSDLARSSSTPATASCSSIASELNSNGKLPVVHRLSPCSPLNGAGRNSNPSPTDVFRRDAQRLRSLFAARSGVADSMAAAPAPAPAGVTIPTDGTPVTLAPGVLDYSVLVGYGTPAQQLPLALDTSVGISQIRCKPCASGAPSCDPAFDTSRSSTFTHVPCGSPDCRSNCSGSVCPLPFPVKGTVVQDVLTLIPSASVHDFTFGCVEAHSPGSRPFVGALDLSRDSRSLASRLASPGTPAFSYCLPQDPSSHGFLSVGGGRPEYSGGGVQHAPLVQNPAFPNMYFVDVVGMSLGGEELPIPRAALSANGTALDMGIRVNLLKPAVYAPLRDAFRRQMSQYPSAPAFEILDTCYNFTGLPEIDIPLVEIKFGNGESLVLHTFQMLYFVDPSAGPFSVACLGFAPLQSDSSPFSVIGALAQTSTEVVYDVAGGKVGFVPRSC
ncbi:hypothetical protein ACP70R_042662 [Stipagrostis hirtigluma subsp. patula]